MEYRTPKEAALSGIFLRGTFSFSVRGNELRVRFVLAEDGPFHRMLISQKMPEDARRIAAAHRADRI
jgi:hypothetical protein